MTATLHVWPNIDRSGASLVVYAEDSVTVIPSVGGAIVPYAPYYRDLQAAGKLVDYDPLGLSGDPITVSPITRVSAGLVKILTTSLASMPGLGDGEQILTAGYRADGDGGGCHWRFAEHVSAGANGYDKINTTNGQWQMVIDGAYINARWFGAYGDGIHNDQPALQAFINRGYGYGADLHIPYGNYLCLSTLKTTYLAAAGPNYNYRIRGDGFGGFSHGGTRIIWGGTYNASAVLFQAGAPDCQIENIEFTDKTNGEAPAAATYCACLVNIGGGVGEVAYNTHMCFSHVSTIGGDYGVVFDYNLVAAGNSEDSSFRECAIQSARIANVWMRSNSPYNVVQPYNTVFEGCYITNFLGSSPGIPYGIGILCDTESSTLTLSNCDIQRVAVHLVLNKAPQATVMKDCHSEQFKKLVRANMVFDTNSTITIERGRYTTGGVNLASEGSQSTFAANDYNVIEVRCATTLNLYGNQFNDGYVQFATWFIETIGNDINSKGNRYPHLRPFRRSGGGYSQDWTKLRGRTFSEGDWAPDASNNRTKMPVLKGCENGGGVVVFAATGGAPSATTLHVTFDQVEPYSTQFGVAQPIAYNVNLAIRSVTGAFTPPMPYVTNMAKDGFDINITSAVPIGATNQIEVSYDLWSGGYNS